METAETFNYFIAGYAVIFGLSIGYVLYLLSKWKALKAEYQELVQESEQDAG